MTWPLVHQPTRCACPLTQDSWCLSNWHVRLLTGAKNHMQKQWLFLGHTTRPGSLHFSELRCHKVEICNLEYGNFSFSWRHIRAPSRHGLFTETRHRLFLDRSRGTPHPALGNHCCSQTWPQHRHIFKSSPSPSLLVAAST